MSGFYQNGQAGKHPLARHHAWLLLSYCHARTAGFPTGTVDEFCRRNLAMLPLGARLTCTAVIRSVLIPDPRSER